MPENTLLGVHSLPAFPTLFRSKHRPPRRSRRAQGKSAFAVLVLLLPVRPLAVYGTDQPLTFRIPPVKVPLNIKDQQVTITASALITLGTKVQGLNSFKLQVTADLYDLQQNLTGLLSAQLDKEDRCGDRIAIQNATLAPVNSSGLAVAHLHYERWACVKILGKKEAKRMVGGNAVMQLKLTPAVEEDHTELRLVPEVGPMEADGSLGELLRSGTVGDLLREKIRAAILSALQRGTDLSVALPPAIQGYAKIQNAQFKDAGSGRLLLVLEGEVQITDEQIQALSKQIKERLASR